MKNQTGATLTKSAREHSLKHFSQTLKSKGIDSRLNNISAKDVERYISIQKSSNVSSRTLQNRMSHLRAELKAIGRDKLANSVRLSSKALAISGASRDGTHRALSQEEYSAKLQAMQSTNPNAAACMMLQKELGLRAREAVQSVASLSSWQKALERGDRIHIAHGTKGGRARDSMANDQQAALRAVKTAIYAVKANGGALMPSSSLQGAMRAYGRACEAVDLRGDHASHALRCMYAQDRFEQYLQANGGDQREALALTSLDLGHGDGRGTYVKQVYLR